MSPDELDFSDAWVEGDEAARWRSAAAFGPGTGAASSGTSVLEVEPGCRLERHTDRAEATIVVLEDRAEVHIDDEQTPVPAGGVALVPAEAPHEVHSTGDGVLRFVVVYADADVVTTYEHPVQPDGDRERSPVA